MKLSQAINEFVQLRTTKGPRSRIVHSYPLVGSTQVQQFDASDVPAGLYFYSVFVNGNMVMSNKVIIMKQE